MKDRWRQSTLVRRVDPVLVVVNENVTKHEQLHLVHHHAIGWDLIEQFLFLSVAKKLSTRALSWQWSTPLRLWETPQLLKVCQKRVLAAAV